MVRCMTGAKFTMFATVLTRLGDGTVADLTPTQDVRGTYVRVQDEDSGEITTQFVPSTTPLAPGVTDIQHQYEMPCYARGYTDLGFRSSANRENYLKGDYSILEMVEIDFPARYTLNRQSLITNIRQGERILWMEEETGQPTVFEVQGVTPVLDPFGRLVGNKTVVTRSPIQ